MSPVSDSTSTCALIEMSRWSPRVAAVAPLARQSARPLLASASSRSPNRSRGPSHRSSASASSNRSRMAATLAILIC